MTNDTKNETSARIAARPGLGTMTARSSVPSVLATAMAVAAAKKRRASPLGAPSHGGEAGKSAAVMSTAAVAPSRAWSPSIAGPTSTRGIRSPRQRTATVRRSPGGDGPERAAAAPESTLAGERAFGPWRSTLAAEPRVPAGLRWRCQHFLLVNLHGGALDEGAVDPWRDPEACRQRPLACDDVDVVYCRTLEEALYATWGRDPPAYESRLRRAAYALRAGGRALAERHPPDALAHLDDDTLARSTEAGRRRLEARQRIEACRAMMSDMQIFDDAPAAVVRCRKCRSADVVSTALQIRSADEPMTVFNRCAGCGARWRS